MRKLKRKHHGHRDLRQQHPGDWYPITQDIAWQERTMALVRWRDYIVTHPDGHEETIRGLSGFCLEWGLTQSALTRVARGQAHHHKGFKIRYAVEPLPVMPGNAPRSLANVITHPSGREEGVTGLAAFCREHGLTPGHMALVARGKRSDHKGMAVGMQTRASRVATRLSAP
jgi:hypothetical protein